MVFKYISPAAYRAAIESLKKKILLVQDLVTGVSRGYKHGLYIYGEGGVGKSYTVLEQLRALEVAYILHNSRMTGKGLYLTLGENPDAIHVLEDIERLTHDANAQGVLRSAMWAQPNHKRRITWVTAKDEVKKIDFGGGLILTSNRPLADLPELRALETRIDVLHFDLTDVEKTAKMYELASQGLCESEIEILTSDECLTITDHVLGVCLETGCRLDLRLQQKAFKTYLQWNDGLAKVHWEDLVASSVRQAAHQFTHAINLLSPEDIGKQKRNLIRELKTQFPTSVKDQQNEYKVRNGGSRADFYRHKAQVENGVYDTADAA